MNLLAAAGAAGSPVRQVIAKSSTLVYGATFEDPVWFREDMTRTKPPRTRVERSLVEVEGYLRDFAEDNPHVVVSLLRFSNVLGTDIVTPISKALDLPMVPAILGFDPRLQFVEEDDVVRSLLFVVRHEVPGVFNVAGDGLLPWSEVAAIVRQAQRVPAPGAHQHRRRAVRPPAPDRPATRGARSPALRPRRRQPPVARMRGSRTSTRRPERSRATRRPAGLRASVGNARPAYHYERDVETFFRHSPAVVRPEA